MEGFRRSLELDPTSVAARRSAAACLRTLGRLDEAAAEIEVLLVRSPLAPRTLVEYARIEIDRGNEAEAVTHLETALSVWAEADAGYVRADEARALLATLTN